MNTVLLLLKDDESQADKGTRTRTHMDEQRASCCAELGLTALDSIL